MEKNQRDKRLKQQNEEKMCMQLRDFYYYAA